MGERTSETKCEVSSVDITSLEWKWLSQSKIKSKIKGLSLSLWEKKTLLADALESGLYEEEMYVNE